MKNSEDELHDLMYGPPTKRGPGRPPAILPATFAEALAALSAPEQDFVRQVISGKTQAQAYAEIFPNAGAGTSRTNSTRMVNRATVRHAIKLGKTAGAVQAITGLKRDLAWADKMLEKKIARAEKLEQYTAVSSLTQQWLKLHNLLVDRAQIDSASLVINIAGVDTSRLIGRVIEHEVDALPLE